MGNKKCINCGATVSGKFFCQKCGTFLAKDQFEHKQAYERSEILIKRIVENLQNNPHYDILWNDMADLYMRKVERLTNLARISELGIDNKTAVVEKMQDFLDLCKNHEFQIAFVGTIKTGKSTLINALLGKNYASMAVTPETAALTKFRRNPRDYVKVTFYTEQEWEKLWASRTSGATEFMKEYEALNAQAHKDKWVGHKVYTKYLANSDIPKELTIWSSSKHPEHYFVKEIEVGISNLPESFPENVVFVDTPGLSDPVAYRSEITRKYIRKANAVFVCVDAQKIQKTEIETIASVFSFSSHNKDKVHIVATHWDKLNKPVEDWIDLKNEMLKRLVGKGFFEDIQMANNNIMYAAAHIHNLCRDYSSLDKNETIPVAQFVMNFYPDDKDRIFAFMMGTPSREYLDEMIDRANISAIQKAINGKLLANFDKLLNDDIQRKYIDVLHEIRRYTEDKRSDMDNLIETSTATIGVMQARLKEEEENIAEIERCKQQLNALLVSVDKQTKSRLKRLMPNLDRMINEVGRK